MSRYNATQNLTLPELMICGGVTGVVGTSILGPAELMKVQQQTATARGLDSSFKAVVKRLYAGRKTTTTTTTKKRGGGAK